MPAQTIANTKTTTSTKYGGDALNNVNRYLNGFDVTSAIGTPIIRTPTKIASDTLIFVDPAEDNTITVKVPALTTNKSINIVPTNVDDNDEPLYRTTVQTVTGKVIAAGSNTITGLANANIASGAAIDWTKISKTGALLTDLGGLVTTSMIADGTIVNADVNTSAAIDATKLVNVQKDTTKEKFGSYSAADGWEVRGADLLEGLWGLGTISNFVDATGSANGFATEATAANATAGIVKITTVGASNGWMRLNYLPVERVRVFLPARTSNDSRFFHGWYTTATLIPASDTSPMNVNDGGVLIGYNSTDANIMVYYGPADGSTTPPTPINTGVAIPNATLAYIFEISVASATSVTATIYNANTLAVLYTTTLTTNLPAGTKSLNFHNVLQNTTTTNKTITIYSAYVRAVK